MGTGPRLSASILALALLAACAGARPPAEPAPPAPTPAPAPAPAPTPPLSTPRPAVAPAPAPEPAGRELSSPVEDGEAGVLEEETRESIRETEERLAALGEEAERRETVAAVRSLLEQSRSALAGGELERAHNLARKARELAGEL